MGSSAMGRVVGNFSWLLIDKCSRFVLTVVVSALDALHLGPAQLGQLNYAVAFCSILGFLATQGLDQLAVRELVKEREHAGKTLGSLFALRLVGAVSCIAGGLLAAAVFNDALSGAGPLVAVIS